MLRTGISEVNITPELGLPMAGMVKPPRAEGVLWPLFGRTVVFDDGVRRAAVVCLDLLALMPSTVAELRQAMTAGTELEPTDVMITCTHTHRAPYTVPIMDEPANYAYLDFLRERLVAGMLRALAARRPARVKVGHVDAPGWTFNRRPVYLTSMGEQVGTQGPLWEKSFLRLEGPEDNELKVLLVEDGSGGCLGGLVNFACHTTVMGSEPVYSADYAGSLTETLTKRYGGIFGFLQGAGGNLWCVDRRVERPIIEQGPN